jgi:phosphoribosylformylglycinamidine cyclo-ligase
MSESEEGGLSYKSAGVDIDVANATKHRMAESLETSDPRLLNRIGAFASLFEASFPGVEHPVLVLKTEEPGTKQRLAVEHGRYTTICFDMINHLVNDTIVMGATPVAVQDAIICGKLESEVVSEMVKALADACREQDCTLTGGETSEQPGVIPAGTYILTSSMVGVVDKSKIIDGSAIRRGDCVLAIASNGLHTNGYSLVRKLIEAQPDLVNRDIAGQSFLDAVLTPHRCYYRAVRGLFDDSALHGMAHITGGGVAENVNRILPDDLAARVDLSALRFAPVFKFICEAGHVSDADMLRTFNMGVGLALIASPSAIPAMQKHLNALGYDSSVCGEIVSGHGNVVFQGALEWDSPPRQKDAS